MIVGATTPLIQAVKDASGTAPIVMVGILDPVKAGFVASLARPGGNVTGLAGLPGPEVAGKQLELLKTAIPGLTRVAVLMNPANSAHPALTKEAEAVAPALGLRARVFTAQNPGDLDAAFAGMAREGAGAVLVLTDAGFYTHRERLADLAARARLPAMYGGHDHVTAGGLMAYGPSLIHQWQRAAMYVDRVLRGAKPADIPVEQPTRFELVINLKTARALGVTIPSSLLLRADHVIE